MATAFEALAMTGATRVNRKAGKVKKVPPPATALTAEPTRPAMNRRPKSNGARPNIAVSALFVQPALQPFVIPQRTLLPSVEAVSPGDAKRKICTLQDRCIRRLIPLENRRKLGDG